MRTWPGSTHVSRRVSTNLCASSSLRKSWNAARESLQICQWQAFRTGETREISGPHGVWGKTRFPETPIGRFANVEGLCRAKFWVRLSSLPNFQADAGLVD